MISEALIWDKVNAAWDRMTLRQRNLWEAFRLDPQIWIFPRQDDVSIAVWTVAVVGRTAVWYNEFEGGFNRTAWIEPGKLAAFGWADFSLEHVVQDIMTEIETGVTILPRVSAPQPGQYPKDHY